MSIDCESHINSSLYTGSKLKQKHQEIRLLTLFPGDHDHFIRCSLTTIQLHHLPKYEALSYAWGDANDRKDILVNGRSVSITRNLHVALMQLRCTDKPRTLWIDAIYIDQNNIPERNQQVELMGQVYQSAAQVLIWLGEEGKATKWAIAHMKLSRTDLEKVDRLTMLRVGMVVYQLQERPWFNRMWVMQEFALGKRDPLLLVGSSWIHWTQFINAWELFYSRFTGKSDFHTSTTLLLSTLRSTFQGSTQNIPPVWQFIIRVRKCLATDPRDHVFALRGLLPRDMQINIVPDYAQTKENIYTSFVSYLFSKGLGTIIMSYYRFMPNSWNSMPSWVPDFAAQSLINVDNIDPRDLVPKGFHRYAVNGTVLDDKKTLRMRGFIIGKIDSIIASTNKSNRVKDLPAIQKFADLAAMKAKTSHSPLQSFQTKEPLWKTLIADNGSRGETAPDSYLSLFNLLRLGDPSFAKNVKLNDRFFAPLTFSFEQHLEKRSPYLIFSTSNGFIGLGMPHIETGDRVVLLFGCSTPWALRLIEDGYWRLVGQLYGGGITSVNLVDEVYAIVEPESRYFDIR
jgi:hypothetical protein